MEDSIRELIAPVTSLEPLLPLTISDANQVWQRSDPATILATIQEHLFPWEGLLIVMIALFVLFALWARPTTLRQLDPTARIQEKATAIFAAAPSLEGYISLSNTLRDLLAKKQSQTTEELIQQLRTSPTLDPKTKEQLAKLLMQTDRVKFAKRTPTTRDWTLAKRTLHHLLNP